MEAVGSRFSELSSALRSRQLKGLGVVLDFLEDEFGLRKVGVIKTPGSAAARCQPNAIVVLISSCSLGPTGRAYQGGATMNIEIREGAHGPTNQARRAMAAAISTGFCRGVWSSSVD